MEGSVSEAKPKVDVRAWLLDAGSWVITFGAALAGVIIATFGIDGASSWTTATGLAELGGAVGIASRIVQKNHQVKNNANKRLNLKFRAVHMFTAGAATRVITAGLANLWIILRPILRSWGLPV